MEKTNGIYNRTKTRMFKDTGILSVINVDTQESDRIIGRNPNTKVALAYKTSIVNPDLTKDIIGQVLAEDPNAGSQECASAIINFFDTVDMLN
eukprot:scaffold25128_cov58-Attheya_sp.AAC.6